MTSAFEKIPPAKLEAKIYGFLEREKLMPTGDGITTSKICGNHNIHPLFIDKKHVKFIAYLPLIALQNCLDAAVKFWCKDLKCGDTHQDTSRKGNKIIERIITLRQSCL